MIICVLQQRQVQQSELNPSGWWLERSWKKHNNKQQSRKYISVPQLHVKKFKYTATGNHKSIPISSINRLKMSFYFFSASVVFCSYICTTQSWIFLWVIYIFPFIHLFSSTYPGQDQGLYLYEKLLSQHFPASSWCIDWVSAAETNCWCPWIQFRHWLIQR